MNPYEKIILLAYESFDAFLIIGIIDNKELKIKNFKIESNVDADDIVNIINQMMEEQPELLKEVIKKLNENKNVDELIKSIDFF